MTNTYIHNGWLWLVAAFMVWSGCRKNEEVFTPDPITVGDIAQQVLKKVPTGDGITTFSVSGKTTDTTLVTASGVRLALNDIQNLFADADGRAFKVVDCGSITIRVLEVTTRSAQLAQNFSAVSHQMPLETGGFIKVEMFCGTKPLSILSGRSYKIYFPVSQASDLKPNMSTYTAITNTAGEIIDWQPLAQPVFFANWLSGNAQTFGYEVVARQVGWLAAARPIQGPALVTFCIQLPREYHLQNTMVWAWLDSTHTLLKMESTQQAGQFCIVKAPLGSPVRLAVVARLHSEWKYTSHKVDISNDQIINLTPETTSPVKVVELLRVF